MLVLPPVADPVRYAGLFVYDFGEHVSVGYTAAEIQVLRQSPAYKNGRAYQIYRVNDQGGFELRGVHDALLVLPEATCFLRFEPSQARRDYDQLQAAAGRSPLPCRAQLRLVRSYQFDPGNLTALVYPAWASPSVASWLVASGVHAGDMVRAGVDDARALAAQGTMNIASTELPAAIEFMDRSAAEVLETVDRALQR